MATTILEVIFKGVVIGAPYDLFLNHEIRSRIAGGKVEISEKVGIIADYVS